MELLVFGHSGAKVLVFPTRGGRFYEYENLRMTEVLREKIEAGVLQLFCIDGIDGESFYCWWAHPSGRISRHQQYEAYVLEEVLPFMHDQNDNASVVSHGCSLGAFFAMSLAMRHPDRFEKVVAFSGRYDLTLSVEWFNDLLDGYYSEDLYYLTPTHFLPNLECEERLNYLRKMEIVFVIGDQDPFLENNRHLSSILTHKNIPHSMFIWGERAHKGYYWRKMAKIYL